MRLIRVGLLPLALAGALLVAGGVAYATIGDGGVIHACFQKVNGQLRVIDAGDECRADEEALSWNQEGPEGSQGPIGEKGDTGPMGPPGPAGDDGTSRLAGQRCPSGTQVMGFDGTGDIVCNGVAPAPPPPPPPPPPAPSGWTLVPSTTVASFGSRPVGTSGPSIFVTLTNPTSVTANIGTGSLVVITGSASSDFTWADNCSVVPPGASCTLRLDFTPTAVGARVATAVVVTPLASPVINLIGMGT